MITAYLSSNRLDLPESFSWELIRESQLLLFDKIVDTVMPQISFPNTERNRAILNNPTMFTIRQNGQRKFSGFSLRSNGITLMSGTLVLTNGYSGMVYGAAGKLAELNRDKKLNEYSLPENITFERKVSYVPGTDGYCTPMVLNSKFFSGISKSVTEDTTALQVSHHNAGYAVNNVTTGGVEINNGRLNLSTPGSPNYYPDYKLTVVSPFLFVWSLIEYLLKENGFYLKTNELASNADIMSLCLYNNVDINSGVIQAFGFYSYEQTHSNEVVRFGGLLPSGSTRQITTFNYADLLPKQSLKELIVGLQNLLNIAFVFNNDNTFSIIDREARLVGVSQDIENYFDGTWKVEEKQNKTLKFIQGIDSNDGWFGEYYVDLSDRIEDFGDNLADYETLKATRGAKIGELRRVLSEEKIYEWNFIVYTLEDGSDIEIDLVGWVFISIDYQPVFINYAKDREIETIETALGTIIDKGMPVVRQPGKTYFRKSTEADFSLRLLFYKGNHLASNKTNNYSLRFSGENNLIEKRWANTAEFLATRQAVSGEAYLPESVLYNLDVNRKVSTKEGEVLPWRIITRFETKGVGITKIEGFKV